MTEKKILEKELKESKDSQKNVDEKSKSYMKKDSVKDKQTDNKKAESKKGNDKETSKKETSNSKIKTRPASKKTFTSGKPLEKNPMMNILDQHQQHRLRLAKIIAGIALLFMVIFGVVLGIQNFQKQKAFDDRVAGMENNLTIFDKQIKEKEDFLRGQAISQAIKWTHKLEKFDWRNAKKWKKRREEYYSKIDAAVPKISESFVQPAIAMDMIAIPKGEFLMGRDQKEVRNCLDELPKRKVKITYPFWIAKTEICNFQYRVLYPQYTTRPHMAKEKKKVKDKIITEWRGYRLNSPTQPAVQVSWHLANKYCEMLTYKEGLKRRLPRGYVYRLPTEAEWEYACRAGSETYFYWGNVFEEVGAEYANCLDRNSALVEEVPIYQESPLRDGNYVTAPAGSYKPNKFGLYDMSGNVWEWCWDWYNPKAYRELPEFNPVQFTPIVSELVRIGNFERKHKYDSTSKVIRGGGWLSPPSDCRSATRDSIVPEEKDIGIGFRIVLAPKLESFKTDKETAK